MSLNFEINSQNYEILNHIYEIKKFKILNLCVNYNYLGYNSDFLIIIMTWYVIISIFCHNYDVQKHDFSFSFVTEMGFHRFE